MSGASLNVISSRKCGKCTMCCHVMGITELKKPKHQDCEHQFEGGCKIYHNRPESCAGFKCDWLRGDVQEEERPDRLGLFFHTRKWMGLPRPIVFCEEGREGALAGPRAKALLAVKSRTQVILIRRTRERFQRLIGPQVELARLAPFLQDKVKAADPALMEGEARVASLDQVINAVLPDKGAE